MLRDPAARQGYTTAVDESAVKIAAGTGRLDRGLVREGLALFRSLSTSAGRQVPWAMIDAVLGDAVLAQSNNARVVEGNVYFPSGAVAWHHLQRTRSHSLCRWGAATRREQPAGQVEVAGELRLPSRLNNMAPAAVVESGSRS